MKMHMTNDFKVILLGIAVAVVCQLTTSVATVSVDTPEFVLSIKHGGVRENDGKEPLAYSPFWGEVTNGVKMKNGN